eukprot:353104-Chlamydomonas_euryale.AAC.3
MRAGQHHGTAPAPAPALARLPYLCAHVALDVVKDVVLVGHQARLAHVPAVGRKQQDVGARRVHLVALARRAKNGSQGGKQEGNGRGSTRGGTIGKRGEVRVQEGCEYRRGAGAGEERSTQSAGSKQLQVNWGRGMGRETRPPGAGMWPFMPTLHEQLSPCAEG